MTVIEFPQRKHPSLFDDDPNKMIKNVAGVAAGALVPGGLIGRLIAVIGAVLFLKLVEKAVDLAVERLQSNLGAESV